jgi:NAD(P)-dependent dehydrogenase (short-subunit alcohol dehydrogenase family)
MHEIMVVTGAASGIGKEIALTLAGPGKILGLIDKNCSALARVAGECSLLGSIVESSCLNTADINSLGAFLSNFVASHGKIGTVFVNAGLGPTQVCPGIDGAIELMEANYFGSLNTISAAQSANAQRSSEVKKLVIISSGSISSLASTHSSGAYSASKSALTMYLDGLRLNSNFQELQIIDVTIGFVHTPMTEKMTYLGVLMERDVALIAKKISRLRFTGKHKASIPFWRNLIWFILRILPSWPRTVLLQGAYRFLGVRSQNS